MTVEEKIAQTESLWITNNLKSFIDEKGNFAPIKGAGDSKNASTARWAE